MKSKFTVLVSLLGLGTVTLALASSQPHMLKEHPVRQEIVDKVKQLTSAWTPKEVSLNTLSDVPLEHIHKKLGHISSMSTAEKVNEGVFRFLDKFNPFQFHSSNNQFEQQSDKKWNFLSKKEAKLLQEQNNTNNTNTTTNNDTIPQRFDSREKWPQCIHSIRNQQLCGSCWAFASSGFLSDRFCIHSQGEINVVLAPQDLVACNFENFGCSGGTLVNTIDYLLTEGITSESCMPYQNGDSQCSFKCINKTEKYTKYYCKPGSMTILSDPQLIQYELMANGPMMVGLTVYEDFMNYEKGVYEHVAGIAVGGHAIKIIGWDHDANGNLYWICQNQWGLDWGEKGFINIKAGQIGLDSMVLGCIPDIVEE